MFDDVLIESAGRDKRKGGWINAVVSAALHLVIIAAVVAAGYYVKKNPEAVENAIPAFISSAPPPPPPAPAASSASSAPKTTPVTPKEQKFEQPTHVPQQVPHVDETEKTTETNGVVGGQKGGVQGGVVGGVAGGQIGGVIGGQLGGQIGGTGDRPLRVGGDVSAPVPIDPNKPDYTEPARKARIEGYVIVEAVVDRNGNVTDVRILKDLPLGLGEAALRTVRGWRFRPGTFNGQPVDVVYDLTVNFKIQ